MGHFENVSVEVSGVLQADILPAWAAASCFEDTDSYIPDSFVADDNSPVRDPFCTSHCVKYGPARTTWDCDGDRNGQPLPATIFVQG
jgi:hypothetical protein